MTKHGQARAGAKTRVYNIWIEMTHRCRNPQHKRYHQYGGRGIKVCNRWLEFANFYADMGDPPEGFQIDRIDNDKGYYKENCKWETRIRQANNQRNNKKIIIDGKTMSLTDAVRFVDSPIKYHTVKMRIRRGWDYMDALLMS